MAEERCYFCMKKTVGGGCTCPESMKEQVIYPHALRPGTRIKNDFGDYQYTIGQAMGIGGFGIVYVAWDESNDRKVAIKEFFPREDARRSAADFKKVVYDAGKETECEAWKNKFYQEALRLGKLSDEEHVVSIVDHFSENNTAYIVMEYIEGVTLTKYSEANGVFTEEQICQLMKPLMGALVRVHEKGIVHRDISPDNIMLSFDGGGKTSLTLIDFGAANEGDHTKLASRVIRDSFSAPELYGGKNIGPWTDVYSLCATMYYCVTGQAPMGAWYRKDSNEEIKGLKECPKVKGPFSDAFERTLMKGLSYSRINRQQTMGGLMAEFGMRTDAPVHEKVPKEEGAGGEAVAAKGKRKKTKRNVMVVLFLLLFCFLFWNVGKWIGGRPANGKDNMVESSKESDSKGKENSDKENSGEEEKTPTPEPLEKEEQEETQIPSPTPTSEPEANVTKAPALVPLRIGFYVKNEKNGENECRLEKNVEVEAGKPISLEPYFREFELNLTEKSGFEYSIIPNGISYMDDSQTFPRVTVEEGMSAYITILCTKKQYDVSVTWDTDRADITGTGKYCAGDTVTIRCILKDGYVLEGYRGDVPITLSSPKDSYTYTFEMPDGDVVLEAIIKAQSFRVSFDTQGGSKVESMNVLYGGTYSLPNSPSKVGYLFSGWYTKQSGGKRISNGDIVSILADTTLYAHWEAGNGILYTVNHYQETVAGSGYTLHATEEMSGKSEEKITLSTLAKEYEGFRYVGACEGTKASATPGSFTKTSTVLPNGTRVINVYYDRNRYQITFEANGGTVSEKSRSVTMGAELGDLQVPTRDYYTFEGWFTKESGGTSVTASYEMKAADMTVYARWTANGQSDWVPASALPSGASVTDTKWTYTLTEAKESRNSAEAGWEKTGAYWKETGSGSVRYASFPYGYDTEDVIYRSFAKEALAAYENETQKREVRNEWTGFIYWHWMYSVSYASVTNRAISHRSGSWDTWGNPGKGFNYKYFCAFESAVDCPYLDNLYCCNQNLPSYNCVNVMPDKVSLGTGTNRFFRFDAYTSYYTDYEKIFQYKKVSRGLESKTEVVNGGQISDVVMYVKYIEK